MSEQAILVAGIELQSDKPTVLSFGDLFTWVIWQFPRPHKPGMCGAVRPPLPDHGWYPAIILPDKERVQVYGHLNKTYPSPEAAADHFSASKTA